VSGSRLSSYRPGTKDSCGRILKRHFRGNFPRPQHAPVYFGTSSSRAARYCGISGRAQTLEAERGVLRPRNVPFESDLGGLGRRSFAFSCSCLVDSALRGHAPRAGDVLQSPKISIRFPVPAGPRLASYTPHRRTFWRPSKTASFRGNAPRPQGSPACLGELGLRLRRRRPPACDPKTPDPFEILNHSRGESVGEWGAGTRVIPRSRVGAKIRRSAQIRRVSSDRPACRSRSYRWSPSGPSRRHHDWPATPPTERPFSRPSKTASFRGNAPRPQGSPACLSGALGFEIAFIVRQHEIRRHPFDPPFRTIIGSQARGPTASCRRQHPLGNRRVPEWRATLARVPPTSKALPSKNLPRTPPRPRHPPPYSSR
jgi:hypothetical protein